MISSASVFFVVTDSAKNFKTTPSFEVGKLIDESAVLPGIMWSRITEFIVGSN